MVTRHAGCPFRGASFVIGVAALIASSAVAAAQTPVVWSLERENAQPLKAGSSFTMLVKAEIEFGWHLYAINQPPGGPIATEVTLAAASPFTSGGPLETEKPIEGFDPNFNLVTEYYDDQTVFRVPVKIAPNAKDGRYTLVINVRYQSCNDTLCIPPRSQALKTVLVVGNPAPAPSATPVSSVQGLPAVARSAEVSPQSQVQGLPAVARSAEVGASSVGVQLAKKSRVG